MMIMILPSFGLVVLKREILASPQSVHGSPAYRVAAASSGFDRTMFMMVTMIIMVLMIMMVTMSMIHVMMSMMV